MPIKAIILAAGRGKRLKDLTLQKPKCLLEIKGETLLEKIIKNCISFKLNDFLIITGHGKEFIEKELKGIENSDFNYQTLYNPFHKEKQNCYSLFLAVSKIKNSDIVIINSDLVFDQNILKHFLKTNGNCLVVDKEKKLGEEEMKIRIENDRLVDISKNIDPKKCFGEYIGISRINSGHINLLRKSLERIILKDPSKYYEDAFKSMFSSTDFLISETNGLKWVEIDTPSDLEYAKKIF